MQNIIKKTCTKMQIGIVMFLAFSFSFIPADLTHAMDNEIIFTKEALERQDVPYEEDIWSFYGEYDTNGDNAISVKEAKK